MHEGDSGVVGINAFLSAIGAPTGIMSRSAIVSKSELKMKGKERSSSSSDLGEEFKSELLGEVSKSKGPLVKELFKSRSA